MQARLINARLENQYDLQLNDEKARSNRLKYAVKALSNKINKVEYLLRTLRT